MKVIDAFQKLFVPCVDLIASVEKIKFNCWDLLLLAHCLFTHVWRQLYANPLLRTTPSTLHAPPTILEPLKTAIRNWKALWDHVRSTLTTEDMRDMGFESSADSYWTLTKLIVHRFDPDSKTSDQYSNAAGDSDSPTAREMDAVANQFFKDEPMTDVVVGNGMTSSDPSSAPTSAIGVDASATSQIYDLMPIEVDGDSQGVHLRKILKHQQTR